jgi:hypothetical protein
VRLQVLAAVVVFWLVAQFYVTTQRSNSDDGHLQIITTTISTVTCSRSFAVEPKRTRHFTFTDIKDDVFR